MRKISPVAITVQVDVYKYLRIISATRLALARKLKKKKTT